MTADDIISKNSTQALEIIEQARKMTHPVALQAIIMTLLYIMEDNFGIPKELIAKDILKELIEDDEDYFNF